MNAANTGTAAPSENKGFFLGALENGSEVTGQAAVVSRNLRRKQNGDPFLALELCDRTGRVVANDWDHVAEHDAVFAPGAVVKIRARVGEFNGKTQLTIVKARACREGEYSLADFLPSSSRDPGEMLQDLSAIVASLRDPWLRRLLERLLETCAIELKASPAALRIHHAFTGGLLEHILSLCGAASKLCEHYARLNRDLLLAGCVLHDIGKIYEIDVSGVAIDYTPSGRLVGHIAEGLLLVDRLAGAIDGFPAETRMLVRHMIVSHHGEMQFGALKTPAIPEALALHYLDNLDAKLERAWSLLEDAGAGEFSSYDKTLSREFYRAGE